MLGNSVSEANPLLRQDTQWWWLWMWMVAMVREGRERVFVVLFGVLTSEGGFSLEIGKR